MENHIWKLNLSLENLLRFGVWVVAPTEQLYAETWWFYLGVEVKFNHLRCVSVMKKCVFPSWAAVSADAAAPHSSPAAHRCRISNKLSEICSQLRLMFVQPRVCWRSCRFCSLNQLIAQTASGRLILVEGKLLHPTLQQQWRSILWLMWGERLERLSHTCTERTSPPPHHGIHTNLCIKAT